MRKLRLMVGAMVVALAFGGIVKAQDAESLHRDAEAAVRNGDLDSAIKLMTSAIEMNDKDLRAYATRGMAYSNKREWAKSEADFTVVIKARPEEPGILASRGGARLAQGKVKESLEDFDKLVELRPDSMPHLWQRGIAQCFAGKYEE